MDNIASLLGLALRAGRLAVGEEPVGVASRRHKAYLLLLASDVADNTIRRARHAAQAAGNSICLTLPMTKETLGRALGRAPCAVLAVTDVGFAAALAEKLAQTDEKAFGPARDVMAPKTLRANQRRKRKKRASAVPEPKAQAPEEKDAKQTSRKFRP